MGPPFTQHCPMRNTCDVACAALQPMPRYLLHRPGNRCLTALWMQSHSAPVHAITTDTAPVCRQRWRNARHGEGPRELLAQPAFGFPAGAAIAHAADNPRLRARLDEVLRADGNAAATVLGLLAAVADVEVRAAFLRIKAETAWEGK